MKTAAHIRWKAVPFAILMSLFSLAIAPATASAQEKWNCAVTKAEFQKRSSHQVLVFKDKLWVLNGIGFGEENQADSNIVSFHDTWYSTNGATWTRGADNTPYSVSAEFVALVYNDQIWVCGGHQGC